jgi:hypothetical protein
MLIPAVELTMELSRPVSIADSSVRQLVFSTDTRKLIGNVFEVHNRYETIYNSLDFSVRWSFKQIQQPNVRQEISATYDDSSVHYSNGRSVPIPLDTHNFFSLLMHLRALDPAQLSSTVLNVEVEGIIYLASFRVLDSVKIEVGRQKLWTDEIELELRPAYEDQQSVLGLTDVFFWRIDARDGRRRIWIERVPPRRIVKTEFYLKPAWLFAKLNDE